MTWTLTILDVWILRDQSILLTKNWNSEDEVIYMEFEKFENMTRHKFSQPMLPKTESFNQGLVIIHWKLQFVSFNSPLKWVNTTLSKIISQEIDFLEQLTSFRQLLQSAEVL